MRETFTLRMKSGKAVLVNYKVQGHLHEMYGVDVSAGLISEVTDSIMDEVKAWQDRPLEALY